MRVSLPILGEREVIEVSPGHFAWLSPFGWHDCTTSEG